MSDIKHVKRQLAMLRRHRRVLLKLAENLLDIAETGGAVSREAVRDMVDAREVIHHIKNEIRAQKALSQ